MEDNLGSYRTRLFLRNLEFPDDYIKKCKENANETQFLPLEVKNNIKKMAT